MPPEERGKQTGIRCAETSDPNDLAALSPAAYRGSPYRFRYGELTVQLDFSGSSSPSQDPGRRGRP